MTYSCQKEEESSIEQMQVENEQIDLTGITKLGQKLENPYSVINMKKAWENLKKTSKVSKNGDIKATHLYIKFKPKTEEELDILKRDSTLVLYDIPLDFEVIENGDFYHDPEVPLDQPTYQYTSIPVNKQLPVGVAYEILEELFIPDEDGDYEETSKSFTSKTTIAQLVDESLKLTGNLDENEIGSSLTAKSKWRPAGTIRVYDHITKSYVGVSGVQVRARRWFTTHKGFSDYNGKYSCDGRFRRDANYSIKWDRYEYSIRAGSLFQAYYNGPKRRGDWSVNLGKSTSTVVDDKQQYYAIIHQAALDYYYGSRFGLNSPPKNSLLKMQMKIAARTSYPWNIPSSFSHLRSELFGLLSAQIHIKNWQRPTDQVYDTTIHELSHSVHWVTDGASYDNIVRDAFLSTNSATKNRNRRLLESWPTAVEILFTTNRYKSKYGLSTYEYGRFRNLQTRTIADENHYTSLGWDMLDNIDQRNNRNFGNGNTAYPIDRVSGYSIKELQDALKGARYIYAWRDNIKNKYNNTTKIYLDELFNNWPD